MPLNLSDTRRFIRLMIKPRPSLRFASTARGTLSRRRSFYRHHKGVKLHGSAAYGTVRKPNAGARGLVRGKEKAHDAIAHACISGHAPSPEIVEDRQYSGTETTTDDITDITDINLDDFLWSEEEPPSWSTDSKPRILRSSRHRKAKSVDEAVLPLLRIKDGETSYSRHTHTWPRTAPRSIDWALLSASESELDSLSRVFPQRCVPLLSVGSGNPSNYITAPTFHTSTPRANRRVLQAVDRRTGVVFDRVCQGGVSSDVNLPGFSSDLSYQLVSASSGAPASPFIAEVDRLAKPSMVLTVPTPVPPQSPVFVSQSPITVSKFFEALEEDTVADRFSAGLPETASIGSIGQPPPSLGLCGECGLFEFEYGLQCRDCDRRWLACKVWYRAHDGGRKRWLNTPYIRPGESNAQNRALMHGLGVPGCGFDSEGMVATDRADRPPARAWNEVRRVRLFVKSRAVRAKRSLAAKTSALARLGTVKIIPGVVVLRPARRTLKKAVEPLGLGYLWRRLSGTWLVSSTRTTSGRTHEGSRGDLRVGGNHSTVVPSATL